MLWNPSLITGSPPRLILHDFSPRLLGTRLREFIYTDSIAFFTIELEGYGVPFVSKLLFESMDGKYVDVQHCRATNLCGNVSSEATNLTEATNLCGSVSSEATN